MHFVNLEDYILFVLSVHSVDVVLSFLATIAAITFPSLLLLRCVCLEKCLKRRCNKK